MILICSSLYLLHTQVRDVDTLSLTSTTIDASFGLEAPRAGADDDDDDYSEYSFVKYAATYFRSNQTHHFSKRPLQSALLEMSSTTDNIAAQAIWVTLQRFMGDMAEAKYEADDAATRHTPIMRSLNATLSRAALAKNATLRAHMQHAHGGEPTTTTSIADDARRERQYKIVMRTLKRRNNLAEQLRQLNDLDDGHMQFYQRWLSTRSSTLQKVHFVCAHGILRAELRDEIFCQLCKQLTANPNHTSYATGWIMLALCVGCFAPTARFEPYLRALIAGGPELYVPYCRYRLDRTLKNGARTQPPCHLELRAARTKAPIQLRITLMDERVLSLTADSATTAEEAVQQVAHQCGIADAFGFSVYVKVYEKVMSLGCGGEHVLDALSKCEQYQRELTGGGERDTPWQLFFRKELFAPWHNPSADAAATQLIYRQIVHGLHVGELQCRTDRDIARLAALYVYAEHGGGGGGSSSLAHLQSREVLVPALGDVLPRALWQPATAERKWTQLVRDALARSRHVQDRVPGGVAREDIVLYAQLHWPMMFSRFFDAVQTEGPDLGTKRLIVAVNWQGVHFVSEAEETLQQLAFVEIVHIAHRELEPVDELVVRSVQGDEFVLRCFEATEVVGLVQHIVQTMRKNSVYAVAVQDYAPTAEQQPPPPTADASTQLLHLRQGDLIRLAPGFSGEVLLHAETIWACGECNGQPGSFPTDSVYVLPCITEPTAEQLLAFGRTGAVRVRPHAAPNYNTLQRKRMHTLRAYAAEHFRENTERQRRGPATSSIHAVGAAAAAPELWRHSRDPLKRPLLKRLQTDMPAFEEAIVMFATILKYMGDMPRGSDAVDTALIFRPALAGDTLRDELYCQLMRQLTDNRVLISEERGWELLWLATGLAAPSAPLLRELNAFLRTRSHPLAAGCARRLQRTLLAGGRRERPPHQIEIEAVRCRSAQIFHRVYFPDDTDEAFEVAADTRARHLCEAIGERLALRSTEGFCLFVKLADKVFAVPAEKFVFDFIYELVAWMRESLPQRGVVGAAAAEFGYQLFFMKKLWINMRVGQDGQADQMFYFPQEVPKYLNGFYRVPKADAVRVAALLYRVQFGGDVGPLQRNTLEVLRQIVPEDVLSGTRTEEWRKLIEKMYSEQRDLSDAAAKVAFLQTVQSYPMFGSTFFVVKQTTDTNLPETILIAINASGFHIIDPLRRCVLVSYDYDQLNVWSFGYTYFHVRFGNMMGAAKLLCETSQGYKMDDLLTSYIKYVRARAEPR